MEQHRPMSNGSVALITVITSIVSCVLTAITIINAQKIEFAANAQRLTRIETQNDERARSVEFRLSSIEQRISSLENARQANAQ